MANARKVSLSSEGAAPRCMILKSLCMMQDSLHGEGRF